MTDCDIYQCIDRIKYHYRNVCLHKISWYEELLVSKKRVKIAL